MKRLMAQLEDLCSAGALVAKYVAPLWTDPDEQQVAPCAITGTLIRIEEAHADHAPPRTFGTLAIAFLEARSIDLATFVAPSTDNQYLPHIADPELAFTTSSPSFAWWPSESTSPMPTKAK